MPIDPARALGAELPPYTASWTEDDILLYHLSLGAGEDTVTDPRELRYVYERDLVVLPTFAVVPSGPAGAGILTTPGIDIDMALVLHSEQSIEILRPLPTSADVVTKARISEISDKRRAAQIVVETTTGTLDGDELWRGRMTILARGEGGFGGRAGPRARIPSPSREPDAVAERSTARNQALLYRLSGDKNPLHADPEAARAGGFDAPILHGLYSYGVACKAVVDEMLDGDVSAVASFGARFSGVVYPGETLVTSMWREPDGIVVSTRTKERGSPVLGNSLLRLR